MTDGLFTVEEVPAGEVVVNLSNGSPEDLPQRVTVEAGKEVRLELRVRPR